MLKKDLGDAAEQAGKKIDWLTFKDLEDSIREDLKIIKHSPLIPDNVTVYGFVYDVSLFLICNWFPFLYLASPIGELFCSRLIVQEL